MGRTSGLAGEIADWLDVDRRVRRLDAQRDPSASRSTSAALALLIALSTALYGATCGIWRDARLASYTAVKLPLVFFVTALLTAPFACLVAAALGVRMSFYRAVALSFHGLGAAALMLASLAPVAGLFTLSAPLPGSEARTAHNLLYLMHVTFVGYAGLTGVLGLEAALSHVAPRRMARRVLLAWVTCFSIVGGEVAWVLRPFVGSVYLPVTFIREGALSGNVYEFIGTDILPHLLGLDRSKEEDRHEHPEP